LRGRGLLRGVKLSIDNKRTQAKLRERRILVGVGGDNILRLAPPLIVDEGQISEVVNGIDAVLGVAMAEAGS
jgi:acetylornithine/N-succinyldiaminopimelate aminotransferase